VSPTRAKTPNNYTLKNKPAENPTLAPTSNARSLFSGSWQQPVNTFSHTYLCDHRTAPPPPSTHLPHRLTAPRSLSARSRTARLACTNPTTTQNDTHVKNAPDAKDTFAAGAMGANPTADRAAYAAATAGPQIASLTEGLPGALWAVPVTLLLSGSALDSSRRAARADRCQREEASMSRVASADKEPAAAGPAGGALLAHDGLRGSAKSSALPRV